MDSSRNWEEYNEALVKRGSILLDLDFVADWSRELKTMNERKEGARYRYPESFIKLLAVVHAYVLPYSYYTLRKKRKMIARCALR
jgi:hypothetical protein